ncbi:MAG: oligosaccharide flippase family protein [Caldilineaceae bacterium]|nr:oligosaccharide flippase family protein [Caldilineaceae bacterium]
MPTLTRQTIGQQIMRRLHNRHFLRAGGLLLAANLITSALGVARTLGITWLMPKEEVGMLGVLLAWLPFLQLLSLPGMDSASYHYIAQGHRWAYAVNLAYRLRWSLLSVAGCGAGAWYWASQGSMEVAALFVAAGLLYPATTALSAASGTLAALENFTALFWYRIVEALADLSGFLPLLLGVWWLSRAFTFYLSSQLALAVLLITVSAWLLRHFRAGSPPAPHPADRAGMVHYGRHQTGLVAIGVVQSRADAIMVSAFFPLTVMADYSLALLLQSQMKNFWTIYLSVRYPPLVRMPHAQRRRRMFWEGVLVTLGFAGMGALLAGGTALVVPWLLPPAYASMLPYLYWLLAIFALSVPGYFAEVYFRTEQDNSRQYLMRAAAALLGIAIPLALLPSLGLQAIFWGRAAAALLFSLLGIGLALVYRPHAALPSAELEIL